MRRSHRLPSELLPAVGHEKNSEFHTVVCYIELSCLQYRVLQLAPWSTAAC